MSYRHPYMPWLQHGLAKLSMKHNLELRRIITFHINMLDEGAD